LLLGRFDADFRLAWLPDDRDLEDVLPFAGVRRLRDPGGEDVRVAMREIYTAAPRVTGVTRRQRPDRVDR
jgi:hypothetical protein